MLKRALWEVRFSLEDQRNGRAWRAGIGAIIMSIFMLVPMNAFSMFLRPLAEATGTEIGALSVMFSIASIGGMCLSMTLGSVLKKLSAKVLVVYGGVSLAAFFFAVSVATSVAPLYIVIFFQGIGSIAAGMAMSHVIVSQWFDKRRTTMFSLNSSLMAVASMVVLPVIGTFLAGNDYRSIALVMGLVSGGVVVLMGLFFVSDAPAKYGLKPYGYEDAPQDAAGEKAQAAASTASGADRPSLSVGQIMTIPAFWMVLLMPFLATIGSQAFNTQSAVFFSSIGLDTVGVSLAMSIHSLASVVWSLAFGQVADRSSPKTGAILFGGIAAAGFLLTFLWQGWVGAILAACMFAARSPISGMLGVTMMARLFGTKEAGSLVGFSHGASSLGAMIGPVMAGYMYDATGSYNASYMIVGLLFIVIVALVIWASGPKTAVKIQEKIALVAAKTA